MVCFTFLPGAQPKYRTLRADLHNVSSLFNFYIYSVIFFQISMLGFQFLNKSFASVSTAFIFIVIIFSPQITIMIRAQNRITHYRNRQVNTYLYFKQGESGTPLFVGLCRIWVPNKINRFWILPTFNYKYVLSCLLQ